MSQLIVDVPETLHRQLLALAADEGVALDDYILYALTRQTTWAASLQPISPAIATEQRELFEALLHTLGRADTSAIEQALAEREFVEPEADLPADVVHLIKQRLAS